MKRKYILIIVIIIILVSLGVFDYFRQNSFIERIRYQIEFRDLIEVHSEFDNNPEFNNPVFKSIEEAEQEEQNNQLITLASVFDKAEGNKLYFRVRNRITDETGIYINFEDKIGIINEDSLLFRMVLAPEEETGIKNIPIELKDIKKSEEIIIHTLRGEVSLEEIPIHSLYVSF